MIRPSNINIENHTANFKCDVHNGFVVGLNLNTDATYDEDESVILVSGAELTESCGCITCFPTVDGNQNAQDITSAKTE